jgi:hypothetical protein
MYTGNRTDARDNLIVLQTRLIEIVKMLTTTTAALDALTPYLKEDHAEAACRITERLRYTEAEIRGTENLLRELNNEIRTDDYYQTEPSATQRINQVLYGANGKIDEPLPRISGR